MRFLALHAEGLVDGLYFALPTRTAATQLHDRLTALVARTADGAPTPPVVLAVPGYLKVNDVSGHHLPGYEVHWHDDPNWPAAAERWSGVMRNAFLQLRPADSHSFVERLELGLSAIVREARRQTRRSGRFRGFERGGAQNHRQRDRLAAKTSAARLADLCATGASPPRLGWHGRLAPAKLLRAARKVPPKDGWHPICMAGGP